MKNKLLKLVIKYFNIKGFITEVVCDVVDEALDNAVKRTDTQLDDMAKAALWPVVEEEAKKIIEEKLDMSKLLGVEEDKPSA